jgi:transcriptional regulator with XRE-family HTH domain
MTDIKQEQITAARLKAEGMTRAEIAEEMGITKRQVKSRLSGHAKWERLDPEIRSRLEKKGYTDVAGLHSGWLIDKNKYGAGESLYFFLGRDEETAESAEDIIAEACARLENRSPVVALPKYLGGENLLVISPADIHMGKLAEALETGDEYNMEIAERRTKEGVKGLLEIGQKWGIEAITINTGNDSLHVDNNRGTTTSGTPQSTTGSIFSMFDAMLETWVWVIETAAEYAPVHVVFDPSNHPWVSDWMLNRAVMAWFKNDNRVTFDVDMNDRRHRKYQVYGCNLIGYTHGDGAKEKDLPNLMQYECREWWGKTQRGYWIIKHKHHKDAKTVGLRGYQQEKDHPGVTVIKSGDIDLSKNVSVEIVRSPSGTDGWHDRNGYVGAIKAVEAFIFNSERGQVARFTYPFY